MNIISQYRSPNFSNLTIPIEFVVLHFTAASLERTLSIFMDPATEVSAHLVIDRDGSVYEVVDCLNGEAKRAWHAGRSRYESVRGTERVAIEGFNDRSIGIELVNLNGNIFPYTERQYAALFRIIETLKSLYPSLSTPDSIVGHEQVAGFRGKSDPGRCFEWSRLFSVCYPNQGMPARQTLCSELMAQRMRALVEGVQISYDSAREDVVYPQGVTGEFFSLLSSLSEAALSSE
jgi:N-acetyl-anhydromuramyl-L-alanine amidase AmpD